MKLLFSILDQLLFCCAVFLICSNGHAIQPASEDLCAHILVKALPQEIQARAVPVSDFIRDWTFNGYVFNGKHQWDVARDMVGSFKFTYRSTAGHGIFATKSLEGALDYARLNGREGNMTPFRVKSENPLLIIYSSSVWKLPEAFTERDGEKVPLLEHKAWEAVSKTYGIDIIIDFTGAIVFQNVEAFEVPKNWLEHARTFQNIILDLPPGKRLHRIIEEVYTTSYDVVPPEEKAALLSPAQLYAEVLQRVHQKFVNESPVGRRALLNYIMQNGLRINQFELNWLREYQSGLTDEAKRSGVDRFIQQVSKEPGVAT